VEDVVLARLEPVEPEVGEHLARNLIEVKSKTSADDGDMRSSPLLQEAVGDRFFVLRQVRLPGGGESVQARATTDPFASNGVAPQHGQR